ncbi:hypothetical protein RvY_16403 [Ramazzottius varieornatus]|uniref:Tc1-like transposase DDE domain-containing protein n=1 Tax=Ramazzottius varieornatus TaxID=947166 RepID=A0A1D1W5W5_RAMVA|nr:hypothetical protein RvY_16403 [Ramazzottius varieornatus]
MCCAGISFRGPTKMFISPSGAKINADLYIQNVLKPLIEKEIPRLCGKEAHKVVLHQDNAPAHQARKTQEYLRQSEVKFIPREHWIGNSPDLAPMDFAVSGIFMGLLFNKKPRDDTGLVRAIKTAWVKLPMEKIERALQSWKRRVELMIERKGFQIERLLN